MSRNGNPIDVGYGLKKGKTMKRKFLPAGAAVAIMFSGVAGKAAFDKCAVES